MAKWRALFIIYSIIMLILAFRTTAHAASETAPAPAAKSVLCKVITGDIGQFVTQGKDSNEAREKASEICFDRRIALYEKLRNRMPDSEQGDDLIDSCVNIRCL